MTHIDYLVPNVGSVAVPLYPPADELYEHLVAANEIERLKKLKHIGSLELVFPGVSHSRWDYTVSMLYVITRLRRLMANSRFAWGQGEFSSMAAALQCLALLSNVGHLPGTFCVEKGATRFLLRLNRASPTNGLFAAAGIEPDLVPQIVNCANQLLREDDYLVFNRICGVMKLASNFAGRRVIPA
jgi:hypothetical protein